MKQPSAHDREQIARALHEARMYRLLQRHCPPGVAVETTFEWDEQRATLVPSAVWLGQPPAARDLAARCAAVITDLQAVACC